MTLWHIWIFDAIAGLLLAGAVLLSAGISVRPLRRWLWRRFFEGPDNGDDASSSAERPFKRLEHTAVILGIIGGYLAVYVAYGTLRNQSMLTSNAAINADAGRLLDWERGSPHIRCLYNWYSTYDDGDACLAYIVSDARRFSEASLYIEEVFFIFKQARSDELLWGTGYVESIWYWRDGVDEDPTGLFGYYVASTEPGTEESMKHLIQASAITMPNPCDGHLRVRTCFRAIGEEVGVSEACKAQPVSVDVVRALPNLIATCRAAAEKRRSDVFGGNDLGPLGD